MFGRGAPKKSDNTRDGTTAWGDTCHPQDFRNLFFHII
ncbi:unnamed protein product [Rhodiola kirilowii]